MSEVLSEKGVSQGRQLRQRSRGILSMGKIAADVDLQTRRERRNVRKQEEVHSWKQDSRLLAISEGGEISGEGGSGGKGDAGDGRGRATESGCYNETRCCRAQVRWSHESWASKPHGPYGRIRPWGETWDIQRLVRRSRGSKDNSTTTNARSGTLKISQSNPLRLLQVLRKALERNPVLIA